MPKKEINSRCPLADECERKKCEFVRHELDCPYYNVNGVEGNTIEDQEEIRIAREMKALEEMWDGGDGTADQPEIEYIPVDLLRPHPDNPRKDLGDVTELAASIKANGIFQNLTVIPCEEDPDCYTVIIGHRRLAAAKAAGLDEVPCIVTSMTRKEQLSTMLMENMQRSDLTVFEQAQGFQLMLDMGETVEGIAKQSGFSERTVRRRAKMAQLDPDILREVSERQTTLADFDRLAQIDDINERNKVLKVIGTGEFEFTLKKAIREQEIAKKLPVIRKALRKAQATKISSSDLWNGKYSRIGDKISIPILDIDTLVIPNKKPGELFYYLSDYGELEFYEKNKRNVVKKTETEKKWEASLKDVWSRVDSIAETLYQIRYDFVRSLSVSSGNQEKMLNGLMASCVLRALDYQGADRTLMAKTLGVSIDGYDPDRAQKLMDALSQIPNEEIPMLIYSNFGDEKQKCSYISTYRSNWPTHCKSEKMDALYRWLCSVGYVMSSAEKALQDGTHDIFKNPNEEGSDD